MSLSSVENIGAQVGRRLRLGRVRLGVADTPGSKQLVEFARTTVGPGSLIRTDGARMFRVLAEEGFTHQYVSGYSSPEPEPEPGHVTLPGPHRVASLLKRWNAAPTITGWNASTCSITWTSSPSGSIVAGHGRGACCSTGCCSRASTPIRTR